MQIVTVNAVNVFHAANVCAEEHGFTPDAIREVDSGEPGVSAFRCFESAEDARIWDNQK